MNDFSQQQPQYQQQQQYPQQPQPYQQYQQYPQQPQQSYAPMPSAGGPVYNTRGFLTMEQDYNLHGVISIDVNWLRSLIARYDQGDVGVMDFNQDRVPTGKILFSTKITYSPGKTGRSTHRVNMYIRADLPQQGTQSPSQYQQQQLPY